MGDLAATGNGCRPMTDKAEQCRRKDYLMCAIILRPSV
jgi:hypothetical protein